MGGGKRVMVEIYGKGAEETTRRVIPSSIAVSVLGFVVWC
jgi:hypothetical protein